MKKILFFIILGILILVTVSTADAITVNQAPNQPTLVQPADGVTGVSTSANLEVNVSDPEGDNLAVTFYGRPLDEDFSIIAMPDTQHYTDGVGDAATFSAQTQWIVDNKNSRNIVFVTGLGDIVENGNTNISEWQLADDAYGLLEDPSTTALVQGIPFGLAVGNHDQSPQGGGNTASTSFYNQFFGISRFTGRSYYGGHYGTDNDNNYELFSAGGMDFIIIHLEYDTTPEQAVLDWADGLLTTYSNRRAILTTHYTINIGNPGSWSAQGQAIYNALSDHPNLFLMLGGHMHGEGRRQDTAVNGNVVNTLLSDYQDYINGGDGWLRIMTFSPANDTIQVQTYSPTRNGGSGDFQTDADSQFTLSYDMQGGAEYQIIGTSPNVPSGSSASISWPGLENGTGYEWYVTLDDGNAVTAGSTWNFTTTDPPTNPPGAFNKSNPTSGTTNQSTNPTLSWGTSSGATSYEYCFDTTNDNACSTWTNNGTATTKALNGLSNNTTYYWHVRAVNADGTTYSNGSTNAFWSFTTWPNPPTIAVNDFANYRVFQRDIGGTSKSVPISGTYSNMDWNRVEARVLQHGTNAVLVDWTTIDTTPGGGTFSGNLIVPQGGWYNIETRALDAAGSVIASSRGTNKWGVGMIILSIGQSNMVGHGEQPFTTVTSDLAVNYSNAGKWEYLADPYDDDSPSGAVDNDNFTAGGSMIPALANSLLETFNFPIAFVPSAKDGSNLYSQWVYRNPSNHFDTSTLYGQSITKAQSVGGVEFIIMHQGEADTNAHRTEAQYESNFATLVSNYRQDLYATIPIFICQLGTISIEGGDPRTDADVVAVRNAQHDLDNGVNIFMAATAMDQPRMDDVHYTTLGLNAIGGRMAQTIKYYLGAASYYRGPAIVSAALAGNLSTMDVQIAHRNGNDITPTSGITGFSVLSNGSLVSITSAQRTGVDRIRLTLASAIPQGATVKLRYLWGSAPDVTALVKDNSSLALPLENTTTDITVTNNLPTAPSTLTATAVSTSQINLSWNDNSSDESGFKIERKTGASGTYAQIAATNLNTKTYNNTGLSPSTTYYYRVRAYNNNGDSAYSNEASATTQSTQPISNLALNKPATADSQQTSKGNTASKGNDGNSSTRWSANDGRLNHWWKVDLGGSHTLTGTKVQFQFARNYRYKIEVSTNNVNWTIVANRTTTTSTAQTRQDSFNATLGRYVRITYTGLPWYPTTWASHYEFEVYGN